MTSAYSINLNFNNTIPVKTDFTFKQGDKGITLNLATVGLDTTGTTAHIVFKRSNGTSVEAELTGQTGPSYSYTILGNEFEIPGVVVADLKLYNGDTQRISTASFIFLVTGDTMDGVGGGTGGYSDQLEQLSQEFAETLEEYQDAFGDVGAINPRGEYSALEEYTALDLVSYNGNSYLCREGCTGIAPTNTTYWQVFASGGGGTDDYEDLENKPSINGVELSGDKSTGDLGIEFNDLDDVDMTGVTDGQVPTWNTTEQKYKPTVPAKRADLTSIIATGATNTTGSKIIAGTLFYLNGALVKAKEDIASGAAYTLGTNIEATTIGNELLKDLLPDITFTKNDTYITSCELQLAVQIGNLAIIKIAFKPNGTSIPGASALFYGLPKSKYTFTAFAFDQLSGPHFVIRMHAGETYIDKDGQVSNPTTTTKNATLIYTIE